MFRIVAVTLAGVMLLAVVSGSAATLEVNGGTIQVFQFEVDIQPPDPEIPAACAGPGWSGSTVIHMTPDMNRFYGGNGKHIILGTPGNDTIYGGNGKDCILGGGGDDTLYGGNGPDYFDGGSGQDTCVGGRGPITMVNCESDGEDGFAAEMVPQAAEETTELAEEPTPEVVLFEEMPGPSLVVDEEVNPLPGPVMISGQPINAKPTVMPTPTPLAISLPGRR